jgi:proline dehydrogenase
VGRLEWLVSRAQNQGVKLIIAAERASLRPAVDAIARELMRQYNRPHGDDGLTVGSVIFTTYQAYMRDAQARLAVDLALAEKEGYILGAKLVSLRPVHLWRCCPLVTVEDALPRTM